MLFQWDQVYILLQGNNIHTRKTRNYCCTSPVASLADIDIDNTCITHKYTDKRHKYTIFIPGNPAMSVAHLLWRASQMGGTNIPFVHWELLQWNLKDFKLFVKNKKQKTTSHWCSGSYCSGQLGFSLKMPGD